MAFVSYPMTKPREIALWASPIHGVGTVHQYSRVVSHLDQGPGNTAWPTADLALYVPIKVKQACVLKKLWVATATTGTGNIDLGIFNRAGTKVISTGAVAKQAAAADQTVDVTDTPLTAGLYYMALVDHTNTATYRMFTIAAPSLAAMGVRSQAGVTTTLPTTATWLTADTLGVTPIMGFLVEPTVA